MDFFRSSKDRDEEPKVQIPDDKSINRESAMALAQAKFNLRAMTDILYRVNKTCTNKCVSKRHKEAELNLGETSCLDRCVMKYVQTQTVVGLKLREQNDRVLAQQQ